MGQEHRADVPKPDAPKDRWSDRAMGALLVIGEVLPPIISIPLALILLFGSLTAQLFQLTSSRYGRVAGVIAFAALPLAVLIAAIFA